MITCHVFTFGTVQDKLWQEMEGKEKKGKQAQQAAKKNKKVWIVEQQILLDLWRGGVQA